MLTSLDPIVNLAKRRGFYFPSSEIYGGASGLYDLGPLGVELSNNIKQLWWKRFVQEREDVVGVDAAVLTLSSVLKASGHLESFTDPLIECTNCHIRLRADHYLEEDNLKVWLQRFIDEATKQRGSTSGKDAQAALDAAHDFFDFTDENEFKPKTGVSYKELTCPSSNCRKKAFSEPRLFNMMFKTQLGAVEGDGSDVYLRPETAQGIFVNFKNVLDTSRRKLPFGIAQIGKAFRNEVTIGNSIFRVREFEQMELEYFVRPGEDEKIHQELIDACYKFVQDDLGLSKENLRLYEHPKEKLSHYSKRTVDIEYKYPFGGFGELHGIANRTDFDLTQHQSHSTKDLTYFNEETRERFIPYVIEPSIGVSRSILAVLCDAFMEYPKGRDGKGSEMETVLHISKKLAPVKVAILPLMKKDGLGEKAHQLFDELKSEFSCQYDESGAIGRRYRRQDEIGTPFCVTVDYQTLEDDTVTVRDRDTMEQERIDVKNIKSEMFSRLSS